VARLFSEAAASEEEVDRFVGLFEQNAGRVRVIGKQAADFGHSMRL
jgi:hypothetical protein